MSNLKVKINRGFKRERENKNRGVWFWKVWGGEGGGGKHSGNKLVDTMAH